MLQLIKHLFLIAYVCSITALSYGRERPNILFVLADDQRWDSFGFYGRPEFETPHINQLAQDGVIFDNAYFAVSICMPSRVTMLTGQYFSTHRVGFVYPNNYTLSRNRLQQTYPALLKAQGYRTGFVGKVGFRMTENGSREASEKDTYQRHLSGIFDYFWGESTHSYSQDYWPQNDSELAAAFAQKDQPGQRTWMKGRAALRFLDTQAADQPFCLSISFDAVKHDRDAHVYLPHYEKFKHKNFPIPDNWVEGMNEKLPNVVRHGRGIRLHQQRTSTKELYLNQVRRFATQGYTVDLQVGRLMEKLKEKGLLKNTIIIYTSDNGRFHGSHGIYDKCILYEDAVKAPLIIYDGRMDRGLRQNALVSSVDLAPTILSLAGVSAPASMQGVDLSPLLEADSVPDDWRDTVFMEDLFMGSLWPKGDPKSNQQMIEQNRSKRSRGIRSGDWKYFVYYEHTPVVEELYNLSRDPCEQNNLAHNPESIEILQKLRAETHQRYNALVQARSTEVCDAPD